jgi:hypothetical protein
MNAILFVVVIGAVTIALAANLMALVACLRRWRQIHRPPTFNKGASK